MNSAGAGLTTISTVPFHGIIGALHDFDVVPATADADGAAHVQIDEQAVALLAYIHVGSVSNVRGMWPTQQGQTCQRYARNDWSSGLV